MNRIRLNILLFMIFIYGCKGPNTQLTKESTTNIKHNDSLAEVHEAFLLHEKHKIDSLLEIKNANDKKNLKEETEWENTTEAGRIHKKHPDWSKDDCQSIVDNRVWVGMEYEMLLIERGLPNHINTSNYGNGIEYQACWYDHSPSCFYFKSDHIITSYN